MLASLLTALLFSISAITAHRTATRMGGVEANFWRICFATFFLAIWANTAGDGIAGAAFPIFLLSGLAGIGLGDTAYFQALPRLGSQRTTLLTQCCTAPLAALIEWLWLGTALTAIQGLCVVVILAGVAVALAPGDHLKIPRPQLVTGILFSLVGTIGMALGAVLSRKAYAVMHAAGQHLDPERRLPTCPWRGGGAGFGAARGQVAGRSDTEFRREMELKLFRRKISDVSGRGSSSTASRVKR